MMISNEVLDEFLKDCERPEDLLGDAGLMKELKIKLMERMLGAELTAHLGYEAGKEAPADQPKRRNGTTGKRLKARMARCRYPSPGTVMAVSNPNWLRKARPGSMGSMTRSSDSTPLA